jgi:hypothetical protein
MGIEAPLPVQVSVNTHGVLCARRRSISASSISAASGRR